MLTFRKFLSEEMQKMKNLQHLEHPEDMHFDHGYNGLHHAMGALKDVHEQLKGGINRTKVAEKYDGSPSLVFGHDPKNSKFFVATKSAFNKDPKINYTHEDIDKNHGHAPGLVSKLKTAMEHLPKITPKKGIYQGDVMHSGDDVTEHKGDYNFTPNTIMYTAKKGSEEAKKIKDTKFGIAVHSKYTGPSLDKMRVGFDPDLHNFKEHKDVHLISPEVDVGMHEAKNEAAFEHHIRLAEKEANAGDASDLDHVIPHSANIKTFINKMVREDGAPNTPGYRKHVMDLASKEIEKVSTAKAKQAKHDKMIADLKYIEDHGEHFDKAFKIHHHIARAKDALVKSLQTGGKFEYSINGKPTNPEGYVAVHNGSPVKLVDRKEFSRANFEKHRG